VRAGYGKKIVNCPNCSLSLAINTRDATVNALPLSGSRPGDGNASGAGFATYPSFVAVLEYKAGN
jgi:hypothetical protein